MPDDQQHGGILWNTDIAENANRHLSSIADLIEADPLISLWCEVTEVHDVSVLKHLNHPHQVHREVWLLGEMEWWFEWDLLPLDGRTAERPKSSGIEGLNEELPAYDGLFPGNKEDWLAAIENEPLDD